MNRRALFSFLAVSPVLAGTSIARATQATSKLEVGEYDIEAVGDRLTIARRGAQGPPAMEIVQTREAPAPFLIHEFSARMY